MQKLVVAIASIILVSAFSNDAAAKKLYKWVDANGKVHYSDRVPPEAAGQERKELNSQGVAVKTTERAKTKEEIEAAKIQAEKDAAAKKIADQKAMMDKTLVQSYASEADLQRAHNNELIAIDTVINTTKISLKSQETVLAQHLAIAADKKATKQTVPKPTLDAITQLQTTINTQRANIARKQAERVALQKAFAEKLARYRELKSKTPGK